MPYLKAQVEGIYSADHSFSVILEVEEGDFVLPIFISKTQALSIEVGKSGKGTPKPLTHDLIIRVLEDLDLEVESVTIDDLVKGTFLAELRLKRGERTFPYDVRPSDGIALAVREGAEILISEDVMDRAGRKKEELTDSNYGK